MRFLNFIKRIRIDFLIKFYSLLPLKKNKIIFWSNNFKSYGCNPKYISEYLLKNYKTEFDIVWVFDSNLPTPENLPSGIRIVKYFSKNYLRELHTARFVICNARTSDAVMWKKRKNQIYIQTWHSSLRLKTIEKDAAEFLPAAYIDAAINDSKKIDYIISGCEFSSAVFRSSFWYNGEIIESGTPRIDYLLNNKNANKILTKIGLSDEYNYILYAPTFRDSEKFDYNLNFKKITESFSKKFGGQWKVLYRLHPNLMFKINEYNLDSECINVSGYSDMQELIVVCDSMITDYSSCMFDMLYANKPCFLYMPDYEHYINTERKMYFDLHKLPFPKSFDENMLLASIENFDDTYINAIKSFLMNIGSFENGTSLKTIANILLERRNK